MENRETMAAQTAASYKKNRTVRLAQARAWHIAHPERNKAAVKRWRLKYPERNTAKEAARRARKLKQMCQCCSPQERGAVYAWAAALGCEVDHKKPLRLGGLHCCQNLQTLTPEEHKAKTARDAALIAAQRQWETALAIAA